MSEQSSYTRQLNKLQQQRCNDCLGEGGHYELKKSHPHALASHWTWTECNQCKGSGFDPKPKARFVDHEN